MLGAAYRLRGKYDEREDLATAFIAMPAFCGSQKLIFALVDYWQYHKKLGRYGDRVGRNEMALGHLGELPSEVVTNLREGDAIFTQRTDAGSPMCSRTVSIESGPGRGDEGTIVRSTSRRERISGSREVARPSDRHATMPPIIEATKRMPRCSSSCASGPERSPARETRTIFSS